MTLDDLLFASLLLIPIAYGVYAAVARMRYRQRRKRHS